MTGWQRPPIASGEGHGEGERGVRHADAGGEPDVVEEAVVPAAASPPEAAEPEIAEGGDGRRRRALPLALAAWLALAALLAGGAFAAVEAISDLRDEGTEGSPVNAVEEDLGASGPPLPGEDAVERATEWDPEIRPLVGFVERERGLPFRAPVEVELLAQDEFERVLAADQADFLEDLSAADRDALRAESGVLRALGLFDGEYDLLAHLGDPSSAVLGYYDHDAEVIRVSSEELDLFTRATVVHELTHALQDQYFDLGRMEDIERDGALAAFRALFEGDASRVETAYVDRFNREEQEQFVEEAHRFFEERIAGEASEATDDQVPEIYATYTAAPYVLGEVFVTLLAEARGEEAVDAAFREPPSGEEHILDPWTFIDGQDRRSIGLPELRPGERLIETGDLGALTWYLALAERVDPQATLLAFDGFGSDSFATFEREGRVCIAARFQGDTNADNAEMLVALEAWRDAMPAGAVAVEREATFIEFESCDPGPEHAQVTGRSTVAVLLPLVRSSMAAGTLSEGGTRVEAECVGERTIEEFSLDELADFGVALAGGGDGGLLGRLGGVIGECLGQDGPGGDPGTGVRR